MAWIARLERSLNLDENHIFSWHASGAALHFNLSVVLVPYSSRKFSIGWLPLFSRYASKAPLMGFRFDALEINILLFCLKTNRSPQWANLASITKVWYVRFHKTLYKPSCFGYKQRNLQFPVHRVFDGSLHLFQNLTILGNLYRVMNIPGAPPQHCYPMLPRALPKREFTYV